MMSLVQRCIGIGLMVGWSAIATNQVYSQQRSELGSLYSRGVNAYFAGRSSEAEMYLSQALAIESQDPRLYYFRGLSLLRLGRVDEARGDMMVGASFEAQRPNRFAIGRALERVQGSDRLVLEQFRRQSRSQAATSHVALKLQHRQQLSVPDAEVLRERVVIPLDRLLDARPPQPLSAEELAERSRRFREIERRPSAPTGARAVPPTAGGNPFRDDNPGEQRVARPAEAPPTPGPAAEEAAEAAEEEAEAEEDPFSDL